MKKISLLVIAGLLAVGAAGCADDYYAGDYGYDYGHHYYDHDRGGGWVWDGARRYCRMPDGRYEACGIRDYE